MACTASASASASLRSVCTGSHRRVPGRDRLRRGGERDAHGQGGDARDRDSHPPILSSAPIRLTGFPPHPDTNGNWKGPIEGEQGTVLAVGDGAQIRLDRCPAHPFMIPAADVGVLARLA